jgi:hypothetical protein
MELKLITMEIMGGTVLREEWRPKAAYVVVTDVRGKGMIITSGGLLI